MAGILGYFFGASGEIVADMETSGGGKTLGKAGFARYHGLAQGRFLAFSAPACHLGLSLHFKSVGVGEAAGVMIPPWAGW
jgi:hypothetical protein